MRTFLIEAAMIPIFLSTPNALSEKQLAVREAVSGFAREEGLESRTIGITDTPTQHPLKEAAILARACYGGIILGFEQSLAETLHEKRGTSRERRTESRLFPTPWNQLEAGMLFALRKPLLIFREQGVEGGVFDPGVSDGFIGWLPSGTPSISELHTLRSTIKSWASEVTKNYRDWG